MIKIAIILGSTRPNRTVKPARNGLVKSRKRAAARSPSSWTSRISTCRFSTSRCRPRWGNTVSLTPKHGLRRLVLSMPTFLSRQSTTTELPARSRTQSIFCPLNGTTKRLDSLARAVLAGRARSSICVLFWRRCKWPVCVTRSCYLFLPTSKNFSVFKPGPTKVQSVYDMLDQVIAWGGVVRKP
jgi:hypothetical protein